MWIDAGGNLVLLIEKAQGLGAVGIPKRTG